MLNFRSTCFIIAIGVALIGGILLGHWMTTQVEAGAAELAAEIVR